MSRDGHRDYTLAQVHDIAHRAAIDLDLRHGDPSRAGSWIRERQLALFVLVLVDRINNAGTSIEVPK